MAAVRAQPLSMDRHDNESSVENETIPPPLDDRVIQIVKSSKTRDGSQFEIRPGRLAAELGMSVEDACAELCGLLAAVGGGNNGARFEFETIQGQTVMVFYFPLDFAK